jgi:predicted TIM-barrel enzyme
MASTTPLLPKPLVPPKLSAPRVIAALHLPDPVREPGLSMAYLEDYVLANAGVFAEAGIQAIKLQDQTRSSGPASMDTVANMAAFGRLLKREYPKVALGIILQAHDGESPLVVAKASGASFVRLKVFVGSVNGAEGPKHGLAVAARACRARIDASDVAIHADVHDRTTIPADGASLEQSAHWALGLGADSLVITGSSFADSLARIGKIRSAGILAPVLLGGGVTTANVADALASANGVVVSTALMLKPDQRRGPVLWDTDACRRFMEAAAGRGG